MVRSGGRGFWISLGTCAVVCAAILLVIPPERSIGHVVRIVYLHGALSRAGLAGFGIAGIAGLAFLLHPKSAFWDWSRAFGISGCIFWTAHFLVSMLATRLTWGMWIAWGEPLVTATLQVLGVSVAMILVTRVVGNRTFTATASLLLSVAVAWLVVRTGVIRHPFDPISNSPSRLFQLTYAALLVPVFASMILVAFRVAVDQRRENDCAMSTNDVNTCKEQS